jgi:DNA-binding NarL/FixJ family response regulator
MLPDPDEHQPAALLESRRTPERALHVAAAVSKDALQELARVQQRIGPVRRMIVEPVAVARSGIAVSAAPDLFLIDVTGLRKLARLSTAVVDRVRSKAPVVILVDGSAAVLPLHADLIDGILVRGALDCLAVAGALARFQLSLMPLRSTAAYVHADLLPKVAAYAPRERAVLLRLGRGRTNREISAELGLSQSTIRNVVHQILSDLSMATRTEVAVWLAANKLDPEARTPEA